ncbi:MAG: AAA family ATPase [Tannerella sp.]|jgi:predicted AAA+ superfamily ATPase|nr:AAA family ATPase [Tannerella sp.]
MDKLLDYYYKLIREVSVNYQRYIYSGINWKNRLIGITGARGVGKTTLMLQHIKKDLRPEDSIYVTVEDFYFSTHNLLDLADAFVKRGGKYMFVDEIHKYEGWSRELKLIYDYHPELNVVFSGSSILDINKGVADLSRRSVMYKMQGLSFREYLKMFNNIDVPVLSLQDIMAHVEIPVLAHPLPLFADYLKRGYYPFMRDGDYALRLQQIISHTLESDIPLYAGMNVSTGRKMKRLMAIIAQSVPFKPNFTTLATVLGVSRNNVADYCLYIEEAGLIAQLRDDTGGVRGLGKVEKVFLENTNLLYNMSDEAPNVGNVRETVFFNQTRLKYNVISSKVADFEIDGMTFEVGGKNKTQKQIQGLDNAFVVKDDIEYGHDKILPLWKFGLLY